MFRHIQKLQCECEFFAFKKKIQILYLSLCVVWTYPRQTQSPCSERCACSLRPDRAAPERPPSCLLWTRAPPPSSLPRHCQSPPRPERAGYGPRGSLRTSITSWVQPRGGGGMWFSSLRPECVFEPLLFALIYFVYNNIYLYTYY